MQLIKQSQFLQTFLLLAMLRSIHSTEDGYLRYVKDGCLLRGEAISCVKYKAVKIAKSTIFGDILNQNETIRANQMVSLVPLDAETIDNLGIKKMDRVSKESRESRGLLSEWAELAKYFMKLMEDFFKVKGLRVNLPEGARTVEEDVDDNIDNDLYEIGRGDSSMARNSGDSDDVPSPKTARGKRKKLAVIVPLLSLLATVKTKLMLIPILLSVLLIKKLLLIAALLLPSVLSTLKACKQHHHPMTHYSYFGSNDSNDYSADYGNSYAYSATGGYGKDWASNRAYNMAKHRATASPTYITAPGAVA